MPEINFPSFPTLETKRLHLRPLTLQDDREIFWLRSDEKVNQYIDRQRATSLEDAREFIQNIQEGISKNESLYWAISLKNESSLIGTICLWNFYKEENRAEIGYELLPSFQGKGFMQEAFERVIGYGFDVLQLQTIEAWTILTNHNSAKVLERNRFKKDLEAAARLSVEEKQKGMVIYTLTNKTSD